MPATRPVVSAEISRRNQVLLSLFLFGVTSTFGFLQPFTPLYLQSAGMDAGQIGWIFGLGSGIGLLVQPLWGRLTDRIDSRRPIIILSALGAGIAYLSFHLATLPWHFLVLMAIGSNGSIYLNSAGGTLIGRMVSRERGGAAYANLRVWGSVGYIIVTLVTGLLLTQSSSGFNREALNRVYQVGPLLFFVIAAIALWIPDERTPNSEPDAPKREVPKAPFPENLKWFLLSYFLYVFALYGASNFLSIYMRQVGGSPIWVTGMFAAGVVCEVIVMRWSGRLSDIYGRRPVLLITYVLLPIRLALYALASAPLGVLAVQILHGINFGIMGAIAVALINDLATNDTRGQAQARLAMVTGFSSATAPIVLGKIVEAFGMSAMFLSAALIGVSGAVVFFYKVEETIGVPTVVLKSLKWLANPPNRR